MPVIGAGGDDFLELLAHVIGGLGDSAAGQLGAPALAVGAIENALLRILSNSGLLTSSKPNHA
jgi:hypothetical protein